MNTWQNFILGLCEHLAWPILVGSCIIYYRKDIRKMLARITKLPLGAELTPETKEQQIETKDSYNELIAQREDKRRKALEDIYMKMYAKKTNNGGK